MVKGWRECLYLGTHEQGCAVVPDHLGGALDEAVRVDHVPFGRPEVRQRHRVVVHPGDRVGRAEGADGPIVGGQAAVRGPRGLPGQPPACRGRRRSLAPSARPAAGSGARRVASMSAWIAVTRASSSVRPLSRVARVASPEDPGRRVGARVSLAAGEPERVRGRTVLPDRHVHVHRRRVHEQRHRRVELVRVPSGGLLLHLASGGREQRAGIGEAEQDPVRGEQFGAVGKRLGGGQAGVQHVEPARPVARQARGDVDREESRAVFSDSDGDPGYSTKAGKW